MEKMNVKDKSALRAVWYEAIKAAVMAADERVTDMEPIKDGVLFHLDNGEFVSVAVVVKDASKFDLDKARADYAEKMDRAAATAEKARVAAEKREAAAREKAEKAAAKAAEKAAKENA